MAKTVIINVTIDQATATVNYASGTIRKYPVDKLPQTVQSWLAAHSPETEEIPALAEEIAAPPVQTEEVTIVTATEETPAPALVTEPKSLPTIVTTNTTASEDSAVDGEYRKVTLAEAIYNAIWEVLPKPWQILLDGSALLFSIILLLIGEAADIAYTAAVTTGIPWAKKMFRTHVIPMAKKAVAYAPIGWSVVSTTAIDVAITLILAAAESWQMRKELVNEWKKEVV